MKALVLTSSALSALGAASLSVVGAGLLWTYQTDRSERAAEATKFIDVSQQFDRNVTDMMGPFLQGKKDSSQREALRKNIQDQFLALERAIAILPAERTKNARVYQSTLVSVGTELDKNLPAPQARDLIQAIADAKEAAICVTYDLRDAAGMAVSSEDEQYCAGKQEAANS